ncbi:hypothetical protein NA57DRAFT_52068 [Rhizodiscina lignyota]|uniref:Uncharacterized protein n=1 Tax=Rhizodiscina lignyota TaxID=1504668 RepID=A0A9P4IQP5_9PEZI|nr:hypothetical protein NA57DRAFT_52068 [Rhizodiscina lignyota]
MKATFDFAALVALLVVCTGCAAQKPCYGPNGTLGNNLPCFPDADVSFCCGTGWICTTNLLCVSPFADLAGNFSTLQRGTCTDQSWNSPACPSYCRGGSYLDRGAQSVWNCGDDEYECTPAEGEPSCKSNVTFTLGPIENITTIGGAKGAAFTTALSIASSSSLLSASSSERTTSTSTSASKSSTSTSSSPQVSAPASHSSLSGGAKAGIAVGVIVVVILIALVAYLFVRQAKKHRQLQQHIEGLYTRGGPGTAYRDEHGAYNQEGGMSELPVALQDMSPHELETVERPREM